jgi:hypothetical protein
MVGGFAPWSPEFSLSLLSLCAMVIRSTFNATQPHISQRQHHHSLL